jgi:hypothetical protein
MVNVCECMYELIYIRMHVCRWMCMQKHIYTYHSAITVLDESLLSESNMVHKFIIICLIESCTFLVVYGGKETHKLISVCIRIIPCTHSYIHIHIYGHYVCQIDTLKMTAYVYAQ